MFASPSTPRSPSPTNGGHRARLLIAGAAVVIAGLAASLAGSTPAGAANYDYRGVLITPTGATTLAGMQCGPYGGKLVLTFGTNGVIPSHYHFTTRRRGTSTWSSWSTWAPVYRTGSLTQTVITRAGDWEVIVEIAQFRNGRWYYDAEFTTVANDHPLYNNSPWCHVGY